MYKISVGTMFRNEAFFLKEWIDYHLMIGVEHFYMYNDSSTDNWEEIMKPYIDKGIVEVFPWFIAERNMIWTMQLLAFQEIGKKYGKDTEWLTFIDIDEFILPIKNKSLLECLETHFTGSSAVYMSWLNFGTSSINIEPYDTILDKLKMSADKLHSRNASGKTIFKTACASDQNYKYMWSPHFIPLDDGIYFNGDGHGPIPFNEQNSDILLDGKHHGSLIRINHYCHRDENYFANVRYPRDGNKELTMEHYESFNKVINTEIIDYINKFH